MAPGFSHWEKRSCSVNRKPKAVHFLLPPQYQPRLKRLFHQVAHEIRQRLPDARVEHIGASSIPGAISKGDLDVFVGIARCQFRQSIVLLREVGFSEKRDTLRTPSLCMLESQRYSCGVAVQLVENGSRFEMFLEFRDALRRDPRLVVDYNNMKRRCEGLDEDCYRAIKGTFIEGILNP